MPKAAGQSKRHAWLFRGTTWPPECARMAPAAQPSRSDAFLNHRKKVRPGGDAGLVRPTYPELALGGTTLGAKGVNTRARESDPHAAISARAPATIAPCRR